MRQFSRVYPCHRSVVLFLTLIVVRTAQLFSEGSDVHPQVGDPQLNVSLQRPASSFGRPDLSSSRSPNPVKQAVVDEPRCSLAPRSVGH